MAYLLHRCQLLLNKPIGYENTFCLPLHRACFTSRQPGVIAEACGIGYDQFTIPKNVRVRSSIFKTSGEDAQARQWMELITPTTAKALAYYDHPAWGKYTAITENQFGLRARLLKYQHSSKPLPLSKNFVLFHFVFPLISCGLRPSAGISF